LAVCAFSHGQVNSRHFDRSLTTTASPQRGILGLCFGSFGIDRFYIGNIILGILKLITFGAFFIWTIVDWFLITNATRKANVAIANEVRQMIG